MEKEFWKDVVGYEGIYRVSNLGNVYSLPREWVSGNSKKTKHEGILLKKSNSRDYLKVTLAKCGCCKRKSVHQLVAIAFLNHVPCGFKLVVDHINGNKKDNRVENLQIISTRENLSKRKNTTSKLVGVSWQCRNNKWRSQIRINGVQMYLGLFNTEREAHEAYLGKLNTISNEF